MKNTKIDFIGIGAPKCGSTWVSKCLEEHPEILFSASKTRKELRFFNHANFLPDVYESYIHIDKYEEKGLKWYYEQFPNNESGIIKGEFSTLYLFDEQAPNRIMKHFPDVKILVTLRQPVDMI